MPERLRNVRRSIVFTTMAGNLEARERVGDADLRVSSMAILQTLALR
jgi:hypothetical protein